METFKDNWKETYATSIKHSKIFISMISLSRNCISIKQNLTISFSGVMDQESELFYILTLKIDIQSLYIYQGRLLKFKRCNVHGKLAQLTSASV